MLYYSEGQKQKLPNVKMPSLYQKNAGLLPLLWGLNRIKTAETVLKHVHTPCVHTMF